MSNVNAEKLLGLLGENACFMAYLASAVPSDWICFPTVVFN